jgi:hypothetical protein
LERISVALKRSPRLRRAFPGDLAFEVLKQKAIEVGQVLKT